MAKKKKAWSGRFDGQIDAFVEEFTASIPYDVLLYRHDIEGSIAHARMLGKQKIIPQGEANRIAAALAAIREDIEAGKISFDLSQEDVHMAVEHRLYLRDSIDDIVLLIAKVKEAILARAEEVFGVVMPGYTHMQRAQPVLFSHHLLPYHHIFSRDQDRFRDARRRAHVSPLGAGALAGTTFPVDREFVARELGMEGVCENSIDAVSDRDFAADFLYASAVTMMHLSRL